jgi:tetratricopeptide (TPR) repeat protein
MEKSYNPAMTTNSKIVAGIAALIVLLGVGYLVADRMGGLPFSGGQPSLDRSVSFPANFPEEAKTAWSNSVAKHKADIEADPNNIEAWLDLALKYKMVQDFDGAIEIWEYLVERNPNDSIALHNIGEYYFHEAKNYPKAEDYFLRSKAISPEFSVNYVDLHELYRYVYKQDTTLAAEVIEEGVTKVTDREKIDLYGMLGGYYKEKGMKEGAIAAFTSARDLAREVGTSQQVTQFGAEISALSR